MGPLGFISIGAAEAVAPVPDGTIYLAGRAAGGLSGAFALARLTSTGAVDTTFGEPRQLPGHLPGDLTTPGWSIVGFADEHLDYATALQVLPDGRVLLSGPAAASRWGAGPAMGRRKAPASGIGLAMFDATGRLVSGFGNGPSLNLRAGT